MTDPERIRRAQGRDGKPGIVELVAAKQSWRGEIHQAAIILIDKAPALDTGMPLLVGDKQRRAHPLRLRLNDSHRLIGLLGADDRRAALDDAGLLAGDRGER